MLHLSPYEPGVPVAPTPLVLSDRLISLAEDAERAGLRATATRLVRLACAVFDEGPATIATGDPRPRRRERLRAPRCAP